MINGATGSSLEHCRQENAMHTLTRSPHTHSRPYHTHIAAGLLSSYLEHDASTMFPLTPRLPYARPSSAKSLIALFPNDGLISISHLGMAPFRAKALDLGCHHSLFQTRLYPTPANLFLYDMRKYTVRSTCSRPRWHTSAQVIISLLMYLYENSQNESAVMLSIQSKEMIKKLIVVTKIT